MYLQELHTGAYLGYEARRRLPDEFGLRELWERPVINETLFHDSFPDKTNSSKSISLWEAGTRYMVGTGLLPACQLLTPLLASLA